MKIIISNIIEIQEPTKEILDYCNKELVFKNPEYSKKIQMGFFLGKTPKTIHLYDFDGKNLYLPIGCMNDLLQMYPDKSLYTDYSVKVNRKIESNIKLRDYQKPCLNALKTHMNGMFILPCGTGKTSCALQSAYELQQHTLFIAHTNDLVNQAKTRCEENLKCSISMIADGKVDTSGDIVFATVQTLYKNLDKISPDEFGLVITDEVHHLGANVNTVAMFRTSLDHFASRYKLGLTATLHRADGLEKCIPKLLGNPIYEIVEDGNDYVGFYEGKEVIRFPKNKYQVPAEVTIVNTNYKLYDEKTNTYRDVFDKNGMTISFTKLISDLALNEERNKQIIVLTNSLKGSTIILSDRVDQLKILHQFIPNSVQIDGSTKKKERVQALDDITTGKKKVLLASYKLAKEGLDCPILENIILATPVKDQAIVVQSIGRTQRPYPGKTKANVYDFVDDVSMLTRFLQKRRSVYRKKGWLKK